MERRAFLAAIAAGGSVAPLSKPAVAAGRLATLSAGDPAAAEFQRDDWVPHHTVAIDEDGTAEVSISLVGENAPRSVTFTTRRTTVLDVVDGETALTSHGDTYSWQVDEAATVAFRIRLGEASGRGMRTRRYEDAIVSDVNEIPQVNTWPDGPDTLPKAYRFTFEPPAGWSVASPGVQVATNTFDLNPGIVQYGQTLKNFFAVGDFDVREGTGTDGGPVIRIAKLPAADHPYAVSDVLDLLLDSRPVMREMFGRGPLAPWLALLVPRELERGGLIKADSIIFGDDVELLDDGGSTVPHEQAGKYFRAAGCSNDDCSRWYINGAKSYVSRYALYKTGRVDFEELIRIFQAWVSGSSDAREHEDPLAVPATESTYSKGAAVCALLDVEIRARTDGAQHIGAWIAGIDDQRILTYRGEGRHLVRDEAARPLLYDITGVDYTDFYDRYVHGTAFPENFFVERYSLENPWPVYAAFEYPRVELPTGSVPVDEPVTATVELRNDAERPQQRTVPLVVDGNAVDTTDVSLEPGAATTVTLEHAFASSGEYTVRVPPAGSESITVTGSGSSFAGPGFGIGTAVAGLGLGAGHYLRNRTADD